MAELLDHPDHDEFTPIAGGDKGHIRARHPVPRREVRQLGSDLVTVSLQSRLLLVR
jgi:hypothetical protein